MKNKIANIFATLWFFGVLIWTLLFMFGRVSYLVDKTKDNLRFVR